MQCFRGLLGFNQDLSLMADTAREIPTVENGGISKDGLVFTFKLKPEVKWSDGKPVTAKDYVYSVKRFLAPELAAEYASFYYDIKGAEAYNAGKGKADDLGVKAIDDYTLQFTLERPRFTFLQLMALWPVLPLREDIITKFGDKWTEPPNYIGNGPFILKEWVHQDHLTFEKNPNYWGTPAKLDKIVLKMITDDKVEFAGFQNNELELSRVPVGHEAVVMADPVMSKLLVRYAELTTFAFQFNVTKPPFDNKLVRQALACAVDRESFINKVRKGVGKPALSWIPPGMPGYDANLGKEFAFNPTKAKDLLTQAGYADVSKLPKLTYQFADTAGNRVVAEFLQGQLKDNLGINLELQPMEPKSFSQMVNNEQHTWAWFGWGADYPDPDNWLPEIFGTGAGVNHTLYSNAEVDRVMKQAMAEPDTTKRLALWKKAQEMIVDDMPVVFMFYRERFVLVKPTVKNLKTTGMDGQIAGDMFFDETYIAK